MTDPSFVITADFDGPDALGEPDLARIGLRLGDRSLSRFHEVETGRVRDWTATSPVSMALWFADHWWRLRWEPLPVGRPSTDWRLRHELSSGAGGRLWPPIMIYGAGARMVFAPAGGSPMDTGPVRYIDPPISVCRATAYEAGVDAFFERVRAEAHGAVDATALATVVDQLAAERAEPEMAAWRRLEARLGYDPDRAPPALMERLVRMEAHVGGDAVEEAAIAAPGPEAARTLSESMDATRASAVVVDLALARQARVTSTQLVTPWQQAEAAAWRTRDILGRPDGALRGRPLAEALGASWETLKTAPATARRLPYNARLRGAGDTARLSVQSTTAHDRRFDLARALGDAVWDADAAYGPITRARTDRQKFSRAFAQSLLCPFYDLRRHVDLDAPTEAQIRAAAHRYHVHVEVVRTLLVNKGHLPRETLEQKLEAA